MNNTTMTQPPWANSETNRFEVVGNRVSFCGALIE